MYILKDSRSLKVFCSWSPIYLNMYIHIMFIFHYTINMLNYTLCHGNMMAYMSITVTIKKIQHLKSRRTLTEDKRIHTIQAHHCILPRLVILIHNLQDPSFRQMWIRNSDSHWKYHARNEKESEHRRLIL